MDIEILNDLLNRTISSLFLNKEKHINYFTREDDNLNYPLDIQINNNKNMHLNNNQNKNYSESQYKNENFDNQYENIDENNLCTPELWIKTIGKKKFEDRLKKLNLDEKKINSKFLQNFSLQNLLIEKAKVKNELKKYDNDFKKVFKQMPSRNEKEIMKPLYIYYKTIKNNIEKKKNASVSNTINPNNANKNNNNMNINYNNVRTEKVNVSNNNNNNQNRPYKFGGNKFDSFNQKPNFENHFYQPKFNDDNEIKNFIENLFTEHTLNKVIYLRYKLNDKGQILIDDLANYNALKKNNVDSNKIIDLIKDSNNLEKVEIDGKNYINVKNFSQLNLLTIEQINENKKQMRMNDRMQQNMFQNQMGFIPYGFNYAQMQNFMPNQQFNPIQPQNMNMQPQPFNNNSNE